MKISFYNNVEFSFCILILDMIELVIVSEVMVAEWVVPKMHFITIFGAVSDTGIEPATSRTDSTLCHKRAIQKGGKRLLDLTFRLAYKIRFQHEETSN